MCNFHHLFPVLFYDRDTSINESFRFFRGFFGIIFWKATSLFNGTVVVLQMGMASFLSGDISFDEGGGGWFQKKLEDGNGAPPPCPPPPLWETLRFISLKLCLRFSIFDSILFLLKFVFLFNKITLKCHNSFQN